jgi:hypothetical protein
VLGSAGIDICQVCFSFRNMYEQRCYGFKIRGRSQNGNPKP